MMKLRGASLPLCLILLTVPALRAATFGRSVALPGGASDIVLDERRNQVYLPQPLLNQVQVYSLARNAFSAPITTDATPLSAARKSAWMR